MSEHVLLEEARAAGKPAPLEFFLHERLPHELSAGQKAHRGAHTAALQLLHFPLSNALKLSRIIRARNSLPQLPLFSAECCTRLGLHYVESLDVVPWLLCPTVSTVPAAAASCSGPGSVSLSPPVCHPGQHHLTPTVSARIQHHLTVIWLKKSTIHYFHTTT